MPAAAGGSFTGNVLSTATGVFLGQTIAGNMGSHHTTPSPAPAPVPAPAEKFKNCSALEKEFYECCKVEIPQGDDMSRCRHIMDRFKECLSQSGKS